VVIGGGLLGLEFAWGLKTLGLDVTVLEIADRLLPRQLDHEGSRLFEAGVLETGIKVRKGVKIVALLGDESVEGILLGNGEGEGEGEVIPCQMVLVSAGVKPNKELAEAAGIKCNRGVIVDASMKTSADGIFAAGDVAEINGMCFGLWPMSLEQGKIAGGAALGEVGAWKMTVPSSIFKSMHLQVFSIGDIMGFEDRGLRSVTDYDRGSGVYTKLYFENESYVGGILMGSLNKAGVLQKSIGKGVSVPEMIEAVLLK
jgi:NAD(P)H-nitrite reductase large subunit